MSLPLLLTVLAHVGAAVLAPVELRLRNVAAADAADAVRGFARRQRLDVRVAADPVANVVRVAGAAAPRGRVVDLLVALDEQPPTVRARTTVVRVPAGFAAAVGLANGDESEWTLTPREARLLAAAARPADVVARSELTLPDNQTGFFQVGDGAGELTGRVTPRLAPGGATVLVRVEVRIAAAARTAQTVRATVQMSLGGTVVVRGAPSADADGRATEVFVMTTVERVAAATGR